MTEIVRILISVSMQFFLGLSWQNISVLDKGLPRSRRPETMMNLFAEIYLRD